MKEARVGSEAWPGIGRVVMCGYGGEWTVKDVLDAGWFRGDLQPLWRELMEAMALHAAAEQEQAEPEQEELQSMSEEFRYKRELLTAEETEEWLAERDLTEENFSDYFVRRYWRERQGSPTSLQAPEQDYPESAPELRELLRIELLLSGEFDRLARELSRRVAALHEAPGEEEREAGDATAERERLLKRTGRTEAELSKILGKLDRGNIWLEDCLRMEAAYRRVCDELLTTTKRERTLGLMRLGLTRVEIETVKTSSLSSAQEGVLCLRQGELTMEELAAECGSTCEGARLFLGDCPEELQRRLLSSSAGEVLEPQGEASAFAVCRLVGKIEPQLADIEVQARVDQRLIETHFSELTGKSIRWALSAECPA